MCGIAKNQKVVFKKKQLKGFLAFNPYRLAKLLGHRGATPEELSKLVKNYVKEHPEINRLLTKPTGYMIGLPMGQARYIKPHEDGTSHPDGGAIKTGGLQYDECADIDLLIVVLCSTVGDLYIPNRELSFEKSKFQRIILFPKVEVNS